MFEKMEYRINVKMCRKKKIKQAKSLQTKIHTLRIITITFEIRFEVHIKEFKQMLYVLQLQIRKNIPRRERVNSENLSSMILVEDKIDF